MNVLYHHRTASRDGQEVHISELIAALRAAGHVVTVVSPAGEAETGKRADGDMGGSHGGLARLRALVPDALLPLAARAYEAVFTRRLVTAGRANGADFLYERHALDNRVGRRASAKLGLPFLLEVNAPLAREEAAEGRIGDLAPALRAELEVLRAADAVLVVTEVLKGILVEDGVPAERIHVVPNGIAPERFLVPRDEGAKERLGVEGRLVLGFVGFPRPWHGLDRVVRAIGGAKEGALSEAVLLIGGEGPALDDLLPLAERLGVRDRVKVVGVVNRPEIPGFLDAFDVALQPKATSYASPLKLFEYLARGLPVVAPRQPNLEEVVEDGVSALLFPPDDDDAFVEALRRLAEDAALRASIGAAGRGRIVDAGHTWPRNAERVIEIARSLGAADDAGRG